MLYKKKMKKIHLISIRRRGEDLRDSGWRSLGMGMGMWK